LNLISFFFLRIVLDSYSQKCEDSTMTHDKLIRELEKRRGDGTWKELAAKIGCSAAYLCDVMRGHRRPGRKILEFLGFKMETVYVKMEDGQ
jgi:hypothetical protein